MADQPKSKFGGVPLDEGTASKFGGVAVLDKPPVEPQRPGESRLSYLMRIPVHVDSSRIDAQMEADKADFRQIGEGASSVVHANTADEAAGGVSTALRGGMKIAAKALPAIAPMMPVATVGGLVAGTAGSLVGQAGASAAGAGTGTSSLAGDIAGILAGGMGARLANAAAKILVHPSVLPKLIRILPKGQAMMDAATAIREAATPPVPETPGQILAESQGMDWASLKPDAQATLELAARAQSSTAEQIAAARAQPAPAPRPATQPQQAPASAPQPAPAQPGMTAADMIQQEFDAKQPQPPQPLQGGRPAARIVPRGNAPVRPPLRQPEPTNVQPAPEAAAVAPQPPPARPQSPAEAVAPSPASGSGGQAIPEQVVYRSTKHPGEGISLNNQGMLYTSPDEAYSKNFGPHTQKLVIAPKNTLDLSKAFAADEGITAERMKAFMERNGVSVSEELMRDFHAAEGAGGEALQHFGQFGQKRLVSALQAAGYDSAKIPEYVEGGGKSVSTILFDKSLARPARTLPQVEAAMAQKAPAPLEPPTSRYTSTGEKKSPELRAAEITGDKAAKKAQRWAEAFRAEGVTSEDLGNMNSGDLDVFTEGMKAKNRIDPKTGIAQNETVPKTSFPLIKKRLKALELQESLRDAMSKSGTIK